MPDTTSQGVTLLETPRRQPHTNQQRLLANVRTAQGGCAESALLWFEYSARRSQSIHSMQGNPHVWSSGCLTRIFSQGGKRAATSRKQAETMLWNRCISAGQVRRVPLPPVCHLRCTGTYAMAIDRLESKNCAGSQHCLRQYCACATCEHVLIARYERPRRDASCAAVSQTVCCLSELEFLGHVVMISQRSHAFAGTNRKCPRYSRRAQSRAGYRWRNTNRHIHARGYKGWSRPMTNNERTTKSAVVWQSLVLALHGPDWKGVPEAAVHMKRSAAARTSTLDQSPS